MPRHAPSTRLATHEVTNQPPDFAGRNLFTADPVLRHWALREGGDWVDGPLTALGAAVGSEEVLAWGDEANRYPPELTVFDRYGRRIDEVRFHPSYHRLMDLAMAHRIHAIAWAEERPGNHVAHAALLALFTEAEQGTMCPISMTYASVPALRHQPDVAATWVQKIVGGTYDAPLRPIAEKRGVTIGMAMTEKQGGSDVRANTTRATRDGDAYRLVGHKWFCSAPMCDAFLTLAQTEKGLSCFLVPRITPDGERNSLHVMRLKDKLGNKSNASSEIEYHDTHAVLLGEEGRGVSTIIEMVHHTRLDTIAGTVGIMGMALAQARHHVANRRAFQKTLIDQPAMRAVVADLALEYEAAVALTMRVARAFSGTGEGERAFARLAVAVAKYWLTKRNPNFVYECMECHGGAGYVEESPLPRLFRESPLNAIWEGSGNVIALDILRTLGREPAAREAFAAELGAARGANATLDAAIDDLFGMLRRVPAEADARRVAERMALVLQAALLVQGAPAAVADAFIATRLGAEGGRSFGVLPSGADMDAIVDRRVG
ncbi:MAG: acyl-CoA dehydrogenase family protein [Phreatobacter sp.]|uniref:acyl-CoA dehydrogenase family protein n=1 Tax=Phreatobacter sp. TaxID=1966341 RepID=UPI0040355B85